MCMFPKDIYMLNRDCVKIFKKHVIFLKNFSNKYSNFGGLNDLRCFKALNGLAFPFLFRYNLRR